MRLPICRWKYANTMITAMKMPIIISTRRTRSVVISPNSSLKMTQPAVICTRFATATSVTVNIEYFSRKLPLTFSINRLNMLRS